jgi:drug/metabolite transporter (DMT)-like permease
VSPARARGAEHDWSIEHTHPEPKESRLMLVSLILASVALAAAAQIVLKHGMNQFFDRTGHAFRFDGGSFSAVVRIPAVWVGLGLFGLSAIVWLAVLSRAALSFAYPFAALTYVVIVVYDALRGEQVTALRWAGVALIVAGIVLVSRTPHGGPGSAG